MKKLFLAFAVLAFAMSILFSCAEETSNGHYTGQPLAIVPDSVLHDKVWRMVYMYDSAGEMQEPGSSLIERCWLRFRSDGAVEGYGATTLIDGSYSRDGNCLEISVPVLAQRDNFGPDPFCDYLVRMKYLFLENTGELVLQSPDGGGRMIFVAVPDNVLLGSWRWVATSSSIEGEGSTPQTAGFEFVAHFGDSMLSVVINNDTVLATPYRVQNARVSDCMNVPVGALLRAILVDLEASNRIAQATNAKVTIPYEGIVNFEMDSHGLVFMNLRENTCAGFMYRFLKQ